MNRINVHESYKGHSAHTFIIVVIIWLAMWPSRLVSSKVNVISILLAFLASPVSSTQEVWDVEWNDTKKQDWKTLYLIQRVVVSRWITLNSLCFETLLIWYRSESLEVFQKTSVVSIAFRLASVKGHANFRHSNSCCEDVASMAMVRWVWGRRSGVKD